MSYTNELQQREDYYEKIRFTREDFLDWNEWHEEYTGESRQHRTTNADYLAWLEYQKGMGHAETPELEIRLERFIDEISNGKSFSLEKNRKKIDWRNQNEY